ncbi:MAG: hypothetical protein WAK18_11555 [Nocardioidaceae bacterium]
MTSDGGPEECAVVLDAQGVSSDDVRAAMRSVRNVRRELPSARLELVVHGPAVSALVSDLRLVADVADDIAEQEVAVLLCRNSLAGLELAPDDVPGGIGVVPAALAHCARRQWEGWAYVRL